MNRLTDRSKEIPLPCADNSVFWARVHEKLARYEDSGLDPEEVERYAKAEKEGRYIVLKEPRSAGVHRLEEIARADIEGRLLVLPCKVGDTVFSAFENEGVFCGKVYAISTCDGTNWFSVRYDVELRYDHTWDEIGKTVFFAREDAEKALEGMEQGVSK